MNVFVLASNGTIKRVTMNVAINELITKITVEILNVLTLWTVK